MKINFDAVNEIPNGQNNLYTPESLLKRVFLFLEDKEWASAGEYCERVLDMDPENAMAYLGKLMADLQISTREQLKDCPVPFGYHSSFPKIMRFGDDALKEEILGYITYINVRNENARVLDIYTQAKTILQEAQSQDAYLRAAQLFAQIPAYQDAAVLAEECSVKAEIAGKDAALEKADDLMTGQKASDYEQAMALLETISGWKDADEKIAVCRERVVQLRAQEEAAREAAAKKSKRIRKIAVAAAVSVCAVAVLIIALTTFVLPLIRYNGAVKEMNAGSYNTAITAFKNLRDFKDSKNMILECRYRQAEKLLEEGEYAKSAIQFYDLSDYRDAYDRSMAVWDMIAVRDTVSSHFNTVLILKTDGTVAVLGGGNGEDDASNWSNIVAVSSGRYYAMGLRADGRVVVAGDAMPYNLEWKDMVAIDAGYFFAAGLKADGTVAITGDSYITSTIDVESWRNIVAISVGGYHVVGLKADGTVLASGDNEYGQCDVSEWEDIVAITTSSYGTIGLKADGTVVQAGAIADVSDWTDIVAISAGEDHVVGLKADGTVVAAGHYMEDECDVGAWKDIVDVKAFWICTIGLRADGTAVTAGWLPKEYPYFEWKDIQIPQR